MKKITLIFFMSLLSFCGYAQFPEGFETGFTLAPTGTGTTGWFTMQNDIGLTVTWVQGAANSTVQQPAHTGARAAYLQRDLGTGGIPKDYLVTPVFTVPADPELRFFSRLTQLGDQGSTYKIFILNLTATPGADINSPASYTEIQTWTELQINPAQTTYAEKIVPIPASYVGAQVRIAFMMAAGPDNSDRWLVDDVTVVKKCVPPLTLAATNIGMNSADLSWANPSGATTWDIELIGEDEVPTGVAMYTHTGALPFHVPAGVLQPDTCYKYYVRSDCGVNGKSEWVGAFYFCTKGLGDTCTDPLLVGALPYTNTDNTNNFGDEYDGQAGTGCNTSPWENYLSGNDVVYKYVATFTGEINIDLSNIGASAGVFVYASCADIGQTCLDGGTGNMPNTVSIDGFNVTAGEDYYIVISSYSVPTTPYTLTIQAVACDEPVGSPAANIGMTTVELSWSNPSGATSWGLAVQPKGTGVPSGTGDTVTDNTNYVWDELIPSTAYEYWVRADCNNGTFSAWAGPYYFNTMLCEVADQCSFTFHMYGVYDSWEGHTMDVKQNGITLATLTGPDDENETLDVVVPLCNNMPVQLFWNTGGSSWGAANVGVSVKNSFGQDIFEKLPGQGVQNTTLYNVVVDCLKPYCLAPKGLTAANATQTTVDLGWNGAATGQWEYYIVEAGQPAPTDTTVGTYTGTNPVIGAGPLVEATNYEFYVRMLCQGASTDKSEWSQPFPFSSSVCAPANKCDYEFVLKSDSWQGGWDGAIMTIRQDGTNVAIIGPTFTEGEDQTIIVPLCTGVPFDVFWTDGGGWDGSVGLSIINPFDQEIFTHEFYTDGVNTVIYQDMVDCLNPKCMKPVGLTASNGTMTSIDLGWTGPATGQWEYYIVEAGQPAPTTATVGTSTTTNPTIAAPLPAPATNYEYYVRVICTGASTPTSEWAGPYLMHSEPCNPEDKCIFFFELTSKKGWNYGGNTMTVSQGGVEAVILGPSFDAADNGYIHMVEVALCPDMPIEIKWNEVGWDQNDKGLHVYTPYMEDIYDKPFGEGAQGDILFTGPVSCEAPPCPKPQHLAVSDITFTSATLDWTEMGDAGSWEVWVLPLGSPAPTTPGTIVTSHPHAWQEVLTSGTPYVFYVRALCGGTDGNSTLSGPFKFITLIENDDCEGAITVPVNPGVECLQSIGGTLTGATGSGVDSSCVWGDINYDVWYEFTATSAEHIVSVRNQVDVEAEFTVYEGNNCGANLTEVWCGSNSGGGSTNGIISGLIPGNKYYVLVYTTWAPEPDALTSFEICVATPKSIIVDDTVPVEDIVLSTLIQSSCANIQNITWSTGTDMGFNGIGRFDKGLSAFQLEEGVVLMTGHATDSPGPHIGGGTGEGGWDGDDQLLEYMNDLGLDPGSYHDATVLEFDFVPLANKIKFPFIFASNEYGVYQCGYSDAFAFFLTGPDGETINLALVPGLNSPVSVVTIRNSVFNPDCDSVNETYFDKYYGNYAGGSAITDPLLAPLNFEGNTVKMYAEGDVIPNQQYHIKLVIADRGDSGYDSAVFIGKFDIGNVDLGLDLTLVNGGGLCAGATHTIESGMDPNDYTFTWYKNGDIIPGETGPNLVVNSTGDYKVIADFGGTCSTTDTVRVEFYDNIEVITGNPVQLTICDADGFGTFNLSDNTPIIVGANAALFTVSYHLSNDDALANIGALPLTNYDNVVQYEQIIYVRIVNKGGCVAVKQFSLVVQDLTPVFKVNEDFAICQGSTGTITVTPVEPANYDPADATYSWTLNGDPLTDTTPTITVSVPGDYEVTVNNLGCPGKDVVKVAITPTPVADAPADVTECAVYVLPALSANNNYYTGPGGTGELLPAGREIKTSQKLYVFAHSEVTPDCTSENMFNITIIAAPIVAIVESCEGSNYVLEVMFDGDEIYNVDNVAFTWKNTAGETLGTGSTLVVTAPDTYYVTVTPLAAPKSCPVIGEAKIDNTTCLVPRGISPNGDGMNDEFDLTTLDVRKLEIFNRYGQEVYSKSNYTKEWIGQGSNGDKLPTGTYFYMIERSNGESITGWVYINRQE